MFRGTASLARPSSRHTKCQRSPGDSALSSVQDWLQTGRRSALFIYCFIYSFFCSLSALFIHFEDSFPSLRQNACNIICVPSCIFSLINNCANFQRILLTCPSEICAGKNLHLNHLKCEMDTEVPHLHILG